MSIPSIDKTPPLEDKPGIFKRVGKGIVRGLGHVWSAITFVPRWLWHQAKNVGHAVKGIFSKTPEESTALLSEHSIKHKEVPPNLTPVFEESFKNKGKNEVIKSHEVIPLTNEDLGLDEHGNLIPEKKNEIVSEIVIDSESHFSDYETDTEEELNIETSVVAPQVQSSEPIAVSRNVPDDGNCLFYAIGLSLAIEHANNKEVKELLGWAINKQSLVSDLSQQPDFLAEPGERLRQQAADYLSFNKESDMEILVSLFGGVTDHNEIAQKKIQEEELTIFLLEEDVAELKKFKQTADVKTQLKQKQEQIAIKRDSVEFEKTHLANEDNLDGYIEMSRQKGFYCGTAQILALSKHYDVPIKVIFNYGKANENIQMFNENASRAPITIGHVNGNHFISVA